MKYEEHKTIIEKVRNHLKFAIDNNWDEKVTYTDAVRNIIKLLGGKNTRKGAIDINKSDPLSVLVTDTEKLKAENILSLVKDHKAKCKSDCGVVVHFLLEDFERHMGRKATPEEFKVFI